MRKCSTMFCIVLAVLSFFVLGCSSGGSDDSSIKSVVLNKDNISLQIGETEQLFATITPESVDNRALDWASDDDAIASVDSDGMVTANDVGSTDIIVTTQDNKHTAKCTITVPDSNAPGEVIDLHAERGNNQITLRWTDPSDLDFIAVEITASPSITPITVTKGTASRVVTALTNGIKYTFTVKSMDTSNNKSIGAQVDATPANAIYKICGTVSGYTTSGLVLQCNSVELLPINANGTFMFSTQMATGDNYNVEIDSQPSGTVLHVVNGSGTVGSSNVTNIRIE